MAIPLTIGSLYGGGAVERLHAELQKALDNIQDPNTPAKKMRKVKLELSIKPNDQRNMAEIVISTSCTLAPPEPLETSILIGHDSLTGETSASEMAIGENPGQHSFPDVLEKRNITHFNKAGQSGQ